MEITNWLIDKLDKVNVWFMRIGYITLLAMVIIDTLNVISVKLGLGTVIPSGKEMIEELMVISVYCGVALVHLRQEDIKTEIVISRFPSAVRFNTALFGQLAVIFICIILVWRTIVFLGDTITQNAVKEGLLSVSLIPSRLVMCIGFILLLASSLLVLVKLAQSRKTFA